MATSWTQADIEALEAAMKGGVRSVQFENRRVDFQSITEMLTLLQTMKDTVETSATTTGSGRTTYARFRKGSQ